jgi:hypothetical protein
MKSKTEDGISLDDLALTAGVTTHTIRSWAKRGLPVTQRGRRASGPGDQAVPWIFPRVEALSWIEDHQRETRERNRSPYADRLDPRDPRYKRALQRAQKLNDEIEVMAQTLVDRKTAYGVVHEQFEEVKAALFSIPGQIGGSVAKLTGHDRKEVESRLRAEFSDAAIGLVAKNALPPAPSIIPSDLDEDDSEDDLGDVERLPRLHPQDPRHKIVTLLNQREEFRRSIACGDLFEIAASIELQVEIYGAAKSHLTPMGGRLAQEFGGSNETQREVKSLIEGAIHVAYEKLNALSELNAEDQEL